MTQRSVVAAVLFAGALALGGCGIPTSNSASLQAGVHLPDGLITNTTSTTIAGGIAKVPVFFLQGGRLLERQAPESPPATVSDALPLLDNGPNASEAAKGITTALPPQAAAFLVGPVTNGTATVSLDNTFVGMFGTRLIDALAQIVYTVTASGQAKDVLFLLDQHVFPAFLPDGSSTNSPVDRSDYATIAPAANKA